MSFAQLFWERGKQLPAKSISLILKTTLSSVMALVRSFLRLQTLGWDGDTLIRGWAGAGDRRLLCWSWHSLSLWYHQGFVWIGCLVLSCTGECQGPEGALHTQLWCVCMLSSSRCWILWVWSMLMQFRSRTPQIL